jgi:hypothetical protein
MCNLRRYDEELDEEEEAERALKAARSDDEDDDEDEGGDKDMAGLYKLNAVVTYSSVSNSVSTETPPQGNEDISFPNRSTLRLPRPPSRRRLNLPVLTDPCRDATKRETRNHP